MVGVTLLRIVPSLPWCTLRIIRTSRECQKGGELHAHVPL